VHSKNSECIQCDEEAGEAMSEGRSSRRRVSDPGILVCNQVHNKNTFLGDIQHREI